MRSRRAPCFLLILAAALLAAPAAFSAQVVSTTARGLSAVMQAGGFMIQPVGTAPASYNDLAPPQLLEIVRPGNQPFTIGRMFTSCTCVRLEADSRSYGPGERAVLRLRNVVATPPSGQNYAVYVQITSPISATLRFDTFVQSSQFVPAPDGFQPTRGNVVSDGYIIGSVPTPAAGDAGGTVAAAAIYSGADIEVIVPKADNYVPDTSEYTLRKKAEGESAAAKTASSQDKDTAQGGVPSEAAKAAGAGPEKDLASAKQAASGTDADKRDDVPADKGRAEEAQKTATAAVADAANRAPAPAVDDDKEGLASAKQPADTPDAARRNDAPADKGRAEEAQNAAADSAPAAVAGVVDQIRAEADAAATLAEKRERQAIEELRALASQADRKARSEKAETGVDAADAETNSRWKEAGEKTAEASRDAGRKLESAEDAADRAVDSVAEEASSFLEEVKEAAISAADEIAETAREAEKAGKDAVEVLKDEVR